MLEVNLMSSGRITLGFLLIVLVAMGLFFGLAKVPSAYAVTNANQTTSAQVIVNGFISVTLFQVPIYFSALDPGTSNQLANATGGAPIIIQIDGTTNVASEIYVNATNFNMTPTGGYFFTAPNMSFNVSKSATATANTTCAPGGATPAPCKYGIPTAWLFNETARLGAGANSSVYNWISVPSAQAAGTYTNNLRVCVNQASLGGC